MPHGRLKRTIVVAMGALAAVACASTSNAAPHPAAAHHARTTNPGAAAPIDAAGTGAAVVGHGHVEISAVGDTELGNTPNLPADPAGYLADVDKTIKGHAQIVFANLEGTLTDVSGGKCGGSNGGTCFAFRTPPHYARYLAADGFTILNNANNHSHDFGDAGLKQTINAIHKAGMKQVGEIGQITIEHKGSIPVAFVAFAPYSNTADLLHLAAAKALIRKARSEARVVVVYMHAGAEGSDRTHVNGHEETYVGEDRGNPEKFAHLAIRAGASLVIASGPHVVRGMQFYRGHLIAYSLGNFANFHNFGSGGVLSDSAILHVTLNPSGGFVSGHLYAVLLDSEGHPTHGGGTVSLIRSLSRDDFGASRARFGASGKIKR
jgi:poly-gamma-glutamate capsule biosynthesis protein CapA/YwtB (metallophosphatase superfamily)